MSKEYPILFSTSMVLAIQSGSKTQTRRVINNLGASSVRHSVFVQSGFEDNHGYELKHRYGNQNDLLWVRETWRKLGGSVLYKADRVNIIDSNRWKPSIHMKKEDARLWLMNTGVTFQRIQDISEEDCLKEGIVGVTKDGKTFKYGIPDIDGLPGGIGWPWPEWELSPYLAFKKLWISINGPQSWESNPWVWVISFEKVEKNAL